jgi:hypothetical protein
MATESNLGKVYSGGGLYHVGSYQVAGRPFCATGSTSTFGAAPHYTTSSFPNVTKEIVVLNTDASKELYVTFHSGANDNAAPGDSNNLYKINAGEQHTFGVKCKQVYLTGSAVDGTGTSYGIYASLTHITSGHMFHMTGSGLTE